MKSHQLDIHKILAERQERTLRELELNGGPSQSNDSFPVTTLSDSLLETSISNSQPTITEKKIISLVVLNIFDEKQVFHLFTEDEVNFSWIDKERKVDDVPQMCSSEKACFLQSELKTRYFMRSASTNALACRYLFFLMSVTSSTDLMHTCFKILEEKISDTNPFCIQVPDLLHVLMNYGTVASKLWNGKDEMSFPPLENFSSCLKKSYDSEAENNIHFPRSNFGYVLRILRLNLTTNPSFSESEKSLMFYLMLNLVMANFVVDDIFLALQIKNVMTSIVESYSEEEWKEFEFERVEELVLQSWNNELEPPGILQRICSMPNTTRRGIQLQQCAAYYAVQNLMDFEEVILCGRVLVDDIHRVVVRLNSVATDFQKLFCVVTLINLALDLSDASQKKESFENLVRAINEARHTIRDVTNDMDTNRLAVKDLMCEIAVLWKDSIKIDNVV